jgi:hypothetical protein
MPTFYALGVFSNGITPRSFRHWASLFVIGMIVAVVLFHHLKSKTMPKFAFRKHLETLRISISVPGGHWERVSKRNSKRSFKGCKRIAIWQSSKLAMAFPHSSSQWGSIYRLYEKNPPVAPASRYHLKKWPSIGEDDFSNCRLVSVGSKSIFDLKVYQDKCSWQHYNLKLKHILAAAKVDPWPLCAPWSISCADSLGWSCLP